MRRLALSARTGFGLAALTLVMGAFSGCKSGSALHNRYNNFRAYYNTYYNASQKLEEGEQSLQRGDTPVDRGLLVPVFPVTPASGGASGPFQEAIDKSAELLRNRPTSKWADDALLVIGKAYFYQRNVVGAEQKFRETMAAAALTGDRRLGDEARFWLGRTLAAADRFDDGVAVLEEGLLEEGGDRRWTSRMRLALGELYARAGRWEEAARVLREGAPEAGDADLAARAYVLLGQVEEFAGHYDEAAEAYAAALDAKPAYELAFAAEVNRALVLGIEDERPEEGLEVVGRMLRDDKHYQRRGELALVRAQLLAAANRPADARQQYLDVLYDEELAANAVRPQAHYRLGEFYRDEMNDYVRASAHFDTAATGFRPPPATERPARRAILDLADEARTYDVLAASARRISEVDSLLALGSLSEDEFRARIDVIETERRRVYAEDQQRLRAQREAQAFAGGGAVVEGESAREANQLAAGAPVQGAGFLNYRNPQAVQAGYVAFTQRWGDRPLVPNWRREAAIRAGDIASDVGGLSDTGRNPFAYGEGPPPLDLSAVPRTPDQREEMITELAGLRYELANAFFLSLGRADTAAVIYGEILADTPELPVATRARYALGEIELAAGRADAARPHYEAVVAADPDGPLAQASLARLSRNVVVEATPGLETPAVYDAARRRWTSGAPREAASEFLALADAAPDDPLAPRAYLAAAAAYVEWVQSGAPAPSDSLVLDDSLMLVNAPVLDDSLRLARPMPPDLVSPVLLEALQGLGDEAPPEAAAPSPQLPANRLRAGQREGEPDSSDAPRSVDDEGRLVDDGSARPEPVDSRIVDDEDVLAARRRRVSAPDEGPGPEPPVAAPPVAEAGPDSSAALPAAPRAIDESTFTLHDHLRALAALYPEADAAARATAMWAALPPRWVPPTDSLATDPIGTDPLLVVPKVTPTSDSLSVPDSLQAEAIEPEPSGPSVDLSGLKGPAPLDVEVGGVTWRVQTLSIPAEGEAPLRVLRGSGFRVALAQDIETGAYALLMGQFDTEADAEAVVGELPAWAQLRGEVVPLGGYALVEAAPNPRDDF